MSRLIKRLSLLVFVLFTASFLLAACGGSDASDDPPTRVEDEPVATEASSDLEEEEEPTAEPEPTEEPTPEPTEEPTPEPTEEPTPVPDLAADFAEFSSPEGGFEVKYPNDWVAEDLFGFVVIVSEEDLLEADDFGGEGAAVLILNGTGEELELDLSDIEGSLNESIEQMDIDGGEIIEGPELLTINDQEAARMILTSDDGETILTAVAYIVIADERAVFFAGLSEPDTFEDHLPTFDAMAQTIVMTEPTEPVVELPSSETEGFLFFGDSVTGTIGDSGASTWEILGIAGEMIDIFVSPTAEELDVVVDVLDVDGNSILPDGAVDNSFGVEEILEVEIAESGTYYISVTGFDSSDTGEYGITFNETGAVVENVGGTDTTPIVAGDLGYGTTVNGSISAENQSPSFTFDGAVGDIVNLIVDPDDELDIVIDVLDPAGDSILLAGFDNSFGREITMLLLESEGEHSVVVTPFNEGEVGSFEISLGGPSGSVIFADDSLEEADEEHFFPFNAAEGEIVNIIVMPQGEFDVVVTLFNDDTDEELFTIDRSFDSEGLGFIIPEDANYYYSVTGFVADDENSEGGDALGDYDVMLFGTHRVIGETTIGDTIRGVFSTEDGIIELFIAADADEPITLTLDVSESADGVIEVMDLDNNVLASADENVSGGSETVTYTAVEDGIVIIRVSEFFGGSGAFTLNVDG